MSVLCSSVFEVISRRNVSISPLDEATKIAAPNDSILSFDVLHTNLDGER